MFQSIHKRINPNGLTLLPLARLLHQEIPVSNGIYIYIYFITCPCCSCIVVFCVTGIKALFLGSGYGSPGSSAIQIMDFFRQVEWLLPSSLSRLFNRIILYYVAGKGLLSSSRPDNLWLPGRVSCLLSVDQLAKCTIEQEQLIVFTDRGTNNSNGFPSNKEVRRTNKNKGNNKKFSHVVSLRSSLVDYSIFYMGYNWIIYFILSLLSIRLRNSILIASYRRIWSQITNKQLQFRPLT